MQLSNSSNINFQAYKIAQVKNVIRNTGPKVEIYQLTSSDNAFLDKLKNKINISKLMPTLSNNAAQNWQDILEFTINTAKDKSTKKYLAVCENRPCAIMTVQKVEDSLNLLGVAAIPTGSGKKVHFSGQMMFFQLMRLAGLLNVNSIELEAVKNSAFDLVAKYKELGFKVDEEGERYVSMSCSKDDFKFAKQNISKKIRFNKMLAPKNVKLKTLA